MSLPIFISQSKDLILLQTKWASIIDPVLAQPFNSGLILSGVEISSGTNNINHRLGRKLQGWSVVRMKNAYAQIYDLQDANQMPEKTLVLSASAPTTLDLLVF